MFNFRNRKRFGEEQGDIEAEPTESRPAAEEAPYAPAEAAPQAELRAEEAPQPEQAAAEPVQTPVSEPAPQETAPAPEPEKTEFATYGNEDFSDFNLNNAFDGFNASDYTQQAAPQQEQAGQQAAPPEEQQAVVPQQEPAAEQQPVQPAAEPEQPQAAALQEPVPQAEQQPVQAAAEQAAESQQEPAAEQQPVQPAAEPEQSQIAAPQEPAPREPAAEASAGGPEGEAAQQNAFNPAEYVVNLNYKEKSVFETDLAELTDEEKPEFIEAMRNMIRMMALNTNNLIGLVQRKNKRISQYEDIAKLLESNQRDFENYKRRNADLESKALEEGFAKALTAVLPTLDNFERAIAMIPDPNTAEGVVLIQRQLQSALEKLGVREIEAQGQEFDPNFHNAVMQQETDDASLSDKVVEVFQKGYLCGDKVLRYAQVKVAKKY